MNSVLGAVTAFRACPQVSLNSAARSQGSHPYDDSTLPLIDRSQRADKKPDREEIQMSSMGSNTKSLGR